MDIRQCSICGSYMFDGYMYNGGEFYFCSDDCLSSEFTKEEWADEVRDNCDSCWTDWNDELDELMNEYGADYLVSRGILFTDDDMPDILETTVVNDIDKFVLYCKGAQ
jgi:hypothetical protein